MKFLYITYGIPASGKDTWAREQVYKDRGKTKRVNKDDLRAMMDCNGEFSTEKEKFTIAVRDKIVMQSLSQGYNVIVSDTNFPFGGRHFLRLCEIAKLVGDVMVIEKFFDVTVKEAISRNNNSDRKAVPVEIIYNMFNKHVACKKYLCKEYYFPPYEKLKQNTELTPCVIFDIDGTLAHNVTGRSPYDMTRVLEDEEDTNIANICRVMGQAAKSYRIIIFSGREDSGREDTETWLNVNGILYHNLYMRKTGDSRKDSIVKEELYNQYIKDKFYVEAVFDDRNQVVETWRSLGLTCLQVAPGDF